MAKEILNMAPSDVTLALPIFKVDKEKRIVYGRATAEVLDAHSEIVDYPAAKQAFQAWKGNIREMHQPKAVGSAVKVEFDDDAKEIRVEAYISKGAPDTWEKICDGTLKDYSIGARAVKKSEKAGATMQTRLLLQRMNELSIVDSGACPGSGLTIVKMDGDTPEVAQELTEDETAVKAETCDGCSHAPHAGAKCAAKAEDAACDCDKTETAEKAIEPVVKMGLLDLRGLLALDPAARVEKVLAITGPDAADAVEADVLKRVEAYDVKNALAAINFLQDLVSSEMWEITDGNYAGRAVSPEQLAQIQLLRDASELVLAFLISEFMSQFDDAGAADVTDEAKAAATIARLSVVPRVGALLDVAKVGRRHSKTDEQMLKDIHDNAVKLGAACAAEKVADAPIVETTLDNAAATDTPPAPQPEAITKLEGELTTTKAALEQAQVTIRSQEESVTKLVERVAKLEAQPVPGGPVSRAVHKTFANTSETNQGDDVATGHEVIKALQMLADSAATPAERQRIATAIVTKQRELGIGQVEVRTTPGS